MNVFVLGTGRCGTTTFVAACRHFTNYTAGHETRTRLLGPDRFTYPARHIEADNRLSWMLGRLDDAFGRDAFYVHLLRDPEAVARSYATRWTEGLGSLPASYHRGIVHETPADRLAVCRDLVATVTANVAAFLRDKRFLTIHLEAAEAAFPVFCSAIEAQGDLVAACAEWRVRHNATPPGSPSLRREKRRVGDILRRFGLR